MSVSRTINAYHLVGDSWLEVGVTGVPISAIRRSIEVELTEMMDAESDPQPLESIEAVLY